MTLAILIGVSLAGAAIRQALGHPPKVPAKTWLFSSDPDDIALRSADNLRLLSEDQLRAYEEE